MQNSAPRRLGILALRLGGPEKDIQRTGRLAREASRLHGGTKVDSAPCETLTFGPILRAMNWHVQYSRGTVDHVDMHPTPEEAIEAAYLLIDEGCDVFGIGTGPRQHRPSRLCILFRPSPPMSKCGRSLTADIIAETARMMP